MAAFQQNMRNSYLRWEIRWNGINVEGLLQSSIQEQRPKARLDMHSIEAALSDDASFPDGKIEPGFLDRYAGRIVKSNNRYIWMLQLMNVQQIMPSNRKGSR